MVAGVAIAARLLWVFAHAGLARAVSRHAPVATEATWRGAVVAGWAGMRGTITLAAALSIPLALADGTPFPGRDLVIFLSAGTIVVTLLVQGTTLEWLICRLGVRADETQVREERLARVTAVEAGLNALRGQAGGASTPEATAALGEVMAEYEHRLAELTAEGESRSSSRRRRAAGRAYRLDALRAERAAIDDLWSRNVITDEIHRPLQQLLDHEEAMLAGQPDPK
jgi:CPA1 family monovalent cation:H+ antiporter